MNEIVLEELWDATVVSIDEALRNNGKCVLLTRGYRVNLSVREEGEEDILSYSFKTSRDKEVSNSVSRTGQEGLWGLPLRRLLRDLLFAVEDLDGKTRALIKELEKEGFGHLKEALLLGAPGSIYVNDPFIACGCYVAVFVFSKRVTYPRPLAVIASCEFKFEEGEFGDFKKLLSDVEKIIEGSGTDASVKKT